MTDKKPTAYAERCDILADLWMRYKDDEEFQDFIEYNDIGLPLAYCISSGIVSSSPLAEGFINETFDLFLEGLEREDEGFESLDDILMLGQ